MNWIIQNVFVNAPWYIIIAGWAVVIGYALLSDAAVVIKTKKTGGKK
jgi:hypothetical protein